MTDVVEKYYASTEAGKRGDQAGITRDFAAKCPLLRMRGNGERTCRAAITWAWVILNGVRFLVSSDAGMCERQAPRVRIRGGRGVDCEADVSGGRFASGKYDFTVHCLVAAIVCLFSSLLVGPAFGTETAGERESIEWCDLWLTHANESNLPRVLLIGDSITRGYAPEVERLLAGKAYVNRLATSAFISDPMLLEEIKLVLDRYAFDVIQFNNGLHGWQHGEAEYRAAFPEFYETIRQHARGAKLVWADTTPLKEATVATAAEPSPAANQAVDNGKLMLKADLPAASDARIAARNAIAHDFLSRRQIPLVDLHSPMLGHPEFHADNFHFNPAGITIQAELVAKEIAALLPKK